MELEHRIALVTGAGSGIGRAIAHRFAAEGASVAVTDRYGDRAMAVADEIDRAGGRAIGIAADVASAADIEAMVAATERAFGPVDILVNNAGLSVGDTVLDIDEAAWDLNLDVVLKGAYLGARRVLPGMIERGGGVILNIASVNGLMAVGESAYSAAKAGMISLTANMAIHFGPHNVRVNAVAPGTIRTPIWDARVQEDPAVFDKLARWYPLGRVGESEDVANAALFLCSDQASWITGVTLPVDGGLTCGSFGLNQSLQARD